MNNYDDVIKNYQLWYEDLKNSYKFEIKRKLFLEQHKASGPKRVQIEPTNRCNYKCIMCPIDELDSNKIKDDLSFEAFKIIIDKLPKSVERVCLSGLGEPFLNNDYILMAKYAKEKGLYVEIYNNGSLFNKEILAYIDEINFSVDSPDENLLAKIRKGIHVDTLYEAILQAIQMRKDFKYSVHINFTANSKNYKEIEKLYALCNDFGVDKLFIQGTSNNYSTGSKKYNEFQNFIAEDEIIDWHYIAHAYSRNQQFELIIWYPRAMKGFCSWSFSNIYITKSLDIISCCQKVTKPIVFGNLLKDTFDSIYFGIAMQQFRDNHITMQNIDICNTCPR